MTERPILFSAPLVRAILDGRKVVTRRPVKLPPWLAKIGGDLNTAHPDLLWGVTPGLKVPCADDTTQRLRNPWDWPEPSRLWCVTILPIGFGDGRFGVGDDGFVYRIDRAHPVRMRSNPNHNGYEELRLRFRGEHRAFRVNRLVCEAFYGPPRNGEVARHLDGNRRNNRPDNLDWGTPSQNQADASAAGSFSGERASGARLTSAQVNEIRASTEPQAVLAQFFGVCQPTISKIRAGKRWGPLRVRPPANRPRWASRITLEVTSVGVERLQDITEDDARAEGVTVGTPVPAIIRVTQDGRTTEKRGTCVDFTARGAFAHAWDSIYGAGSWASSPWVWVVRFRRER